jgi:uncharacterized membrane protein YGL010W
MSAAFDWPRRMGVHEAYHRSAGNRIVHWACIPLQLLGVIEVLSQVRHGSLDLALVAIAAVGALYIAADVVAGALMVVFLLALWAAAGRVTTGSAWLDAGLGAALLVAAFVFQTRVGHDVYERGVDDTAMNLAELRRTRNPVPILLIFFYHLVEILFAAGYRPALRRQVAAAEEAERARLAAPVP